MKYKRIFTIVIDSLGVGAEPDAAQYDDEGTDTLGHISEVKKDLHIPNLQKLGIANLHPLAHIEAVKEPLAYYTKLMEASVGKDTGFPKELIDELSRRCDNRRIIGNKAASGTEILDELAEQEINNGDLIVYTSADSVLQICGNEETMGLENLYRYCEAARELTMKDEWRVGRVIARPSVGRQKGEFKRTSNRHDYALKPYGKTVLNALQESGYDVISVGKIKDIFDGEGITEAYKSKSSEHGMQQTIELADKDFEGLCFVNLVDFDALWGHRRDPIGYGEELERFDVLLGEFLKKMREDDLVMITADHGNDPTYKGTDHTREMVPLLLYSPSMKGHGLLKIGESFADIGSTIAENFEVRKPEGTIGTSRLDEIE